MRKNELSPEEKRKFSWLIEAETENEDIEIFEGEFLIWKNGTWKNGTWKRGFWKNGIWKNGTWEDGTRRNGGIKNEN